MCNELNETGADSFFIDTCKMDIAIKTNDVKICNMLEFNKELCNTIISKDVNECKKIDAEYDCITKIAVENSDAKLCLNIESDFSQECIFQVAEANQKESYCNL